MFKKIAQRLYFLRWYAAVRFFGKRRPLQSVVAIGNACNLKCKHCAVYPRKPEETLKKDYEAVRRELEACYKMGSRFVDFEGGEPFLWRDGERTVNDLFDLAREIGFYSTTVTTNAQIPFEPCRSDLVWVSLDGVGKYHDLIRGPGAFDRMEKNVALSTHPCLNANMVINRYNWQAVEETVQYIADHPKFRLLAVSFHTPFPGTEEMKLDWETRCKVIDTLVALHKKGAPLMNTRSGLLRLKDMSFKKQCWISNFTFPDGTFEPNCGGERLGICKECGFGMAAEMIGLWNLNWETIHAGMKVRM